MNNFEIFLAFWSIVGTIVFIFLVPKIESNLSQLQMIIVFILCGPFIFILSIIACLFIGLGYLIFKSDAITSLQNLFKWIFSPIARFWAWAGTINFIEIK